MEEKRNLQNQEEEELNLDELLNVQGGTDKDSKGTASCGLGCYTGGVAPKELTENDSAKE